MIVSAAQLISTSGMGLRMNDCEFMLTKLFKLMVLIHMQFESQWLEVVVAPNDFIVNIFKRFQALKINCNTSKSCFRVKLGNWGPWGLRTLGFIHL